jgi:hypothetical protein
MIDQVAIRAHSARRLWSGTIQHLFQTLDLNERETAPEISESLAAFCEQHPHMPDHTLSLLAARSFCATGDRDAANCVLRHDRAHRPYTAAWLEVLSAEYPFPELYPLFSSRALRPLYLQTVGEKTTWVLDLEKIHLSDADRLEMILMQTLRVLTENVSNVWKKADGQGTLVVNGLSRMFDRIHPCRDRAAPQMIHYLQDILQRRATRNGWSSVPAVLLLDL